MTDQELMAMRASRYRVQEWVRAERRDYADLKYKEDGGNREMLLEAMRTEGLAPKWLDFIQNYLKRAELFGLDTLQGRQALGKALVTTMHCLETAVLVHGPMPAPGVPSGQI